MKSIALVLLALVMLWQTKNITSTGTLDMENELDTVEASEQMCECGIFDTNRGKDTPLLIQKLMDVGCNSVGETQCVKVCHDVALAFQEKGPDFFCFELGNYNQLKAHVFSRVCGGTWIFAGQAVTYELCCYENAFIDCDYPRGGFMK